MFLRFQHTFSGRRHPRCVTVVRPTAVVAILIIVAASQPASCVGRALLKLTPLPFMRAILGITLLLLCAGVTSCRLDVTGPKNSPIPMTWVRTVNGLDILAMDSL